MTKAPRGRPRTFDGARALRDAEDVFRALGFYAAYGSKEQLFREAVELYSSTLGAPMIAALAEQPTAGGLLEAAVADSSASGWRAALIPRLERFSNSTLMDGLAIQARDGAPCKGDRR